MDWTEFFRTSVALKKWDKKINKSCAQESRNQYQSLSTYRRLSFSTIVISLNHATIQASSFASQIATSRAWPLDWSESRFKWLNYVALALTIALLGIQAILVDVSEVKITLKLQRLFAHHEILHISTLNWVLLCQIRLRVDEKAAIRLLVKVFYSSRWFDPFGRLL